MSFGASLGEEGATFRLWAPAAKSVALRLAPGSDDLVMEPSEQGWFELAVPGACAGALYQFVIDGSHIIPDPASRFQPQDVNGPSELVDAEAFDWPDDQWRGRPWHEAVIYELHIGSFTREGTYGAAMRGFERLARLGVTAIELMPLSDFAGARNWGYDGVLPFAPDSSYGRPEALKALIAEAHRLGLMVFIDVVYNHFGPEGNYLNLYAPTFFTERGTDWGQAINFRSPARQFFIDNALYWLTEYDMDGLRLDAVHAIVDDTPHFLEELATKVRAACVGRQVHLVLENDKNEAHYLERRRDGRPIAYDAQWNDDFHHAMHVILTGETDGYYADYAEATVDKLGRALTQGFIYQGEYSAFRHAARGENSAHLPPLAFVNFIQNHDQIGNRAFGERLTRLAPRDALIAAAAILLLAPSPPLLFMGEEIGAAEPFLFFADFAGSLAEAVREGRRREFARFPAFASPQARAKIPDPMARETFERSGIDRALGAPDSAMRALYADLLATRHREIIPRLHGARNFSAAYEVRDRELLAWWDLPDGGHLHLSANLSPRVASKPRLPRGRRIWSSADSDGRLPPWAVMWSLASDA
jgi:maltooligosyltrehalose trehalohydrolase